MQAWFWVLTDFRTPFGAELRPQTAPREAPGAIKNTRPAFLCAQAAGPRNPATREYYLCSGYSAASWADHSHIDPA